MKVVILGASSKSDRYANRAQVQLTEHGHEVFPVSRTGEDILGVSGFQSVTDIPADAGPIHTFTLYLSPKHLTPIVDEVLALAPSRIIFNPGTEDAELAKRVTDAGIEALEACTLVLLSTGQFETA